MRDNLRRTHCGVGFLGDGQHRSHESGCKTKAYVHWKNMLERCYGKSKKSSGLSVCERWHNFQNFAEWCNSQREFYNAGSNLEKDLLVKGNNQYAPDRCCFVPAAINTALVRRKNIRGSCPIGVCYDKSRGRYHSCLNVFGKQINLGRFNCQLDAFNAYKNAKECYMKALAEKYKSEISELAYSALMNYVVEITD